MFDVCNSGFLFEDYWRLGRVPQLPAKDNLLGLMKWEFYRLAVLPVTHLTVSKHGRVV